MKTKQTLQPYQTIWSIGRINWLERYQPQLLVSLHQQDLLKEHLLEFTKEATKVLSDLLMFTPDRDAWDETMRRVFPNETKANMKIKKQMMKEIRSNLGLTKKLNKYLIKDRDKMFSKM